MAATSVVLVASLAAVMVAEAAVPVLCLAWVALVAPVARLELLQRRWVPVEAAVVGRPLRHSAAAMENRGTALCSGWRDH